MLATQPLFRGARVSMMRPVDAIVIFAAVRRALLRTERHLAQTRVNGSCRCRDGRRTHTCAFAAAAAACGPFCLYCSCVHWMHCEFPFPADRPRLL